MESEFIINEQPKLMPLGMQPVSPAVELATVIKKRFLETNEAEKAEKDQKERENKVLALLATYVFLMEKSLERFKETFINKDLKNIYRELHVLKNQMLHTLEEYGISIIDPAGKILDDELEEKVEIIGWVYGKGENRVDKTHEPIIIRDNEVIKLGQIVASSHSATKKKEVKDYED